MVNRINCQGLGETSVKTGQPLHLGAVNLFVFEIILNYRPLQAPDIRILQVDL
ncbi:MAG: hypothetical protein VKL59_18425 [Nostocaceae cyanobacterium]|nr:hypothetical protein [Nostocaceae cyanobacterium]